MTFFNNTNDLQISTTDLQSNACCAYKVCVSYLHVYTNLNCWIALFDYIQKDEEEKHFPHKIN